MDADQSSSVRGKGFKTVVILPGDLPPDQLIFEHLYNLPSNDNFWKNECQFTRAVFTNIARNVINALSINEDKVNIKEKLTSYKGNKPAREIFKDFYKEEKFQNIVTAGAKPYNPWRHWVANNTESVNSFLSNMELTVHYVLKNGYAVDPAKLSALKIQLKKV